MDHISKNKLDQGRALNLDGRPENLEENTRLTEACVAAINDAVENLRQMSDAGAWAAKAPLVEPPIPRPAEQKAAPAVEPALRDAPSEKIDLKTPDVPFIKTIDNDAGPIREKDRKSVV